MAEGEELIELKFRTNDGTDVAHSTYALSMNVATLKQKIVAEWPQGKTVTPKSINDLKIVHAGKVLENNKTLADSRITFGDLPAGVITMHVIVQPAIAKNKSVLKLVEKQHIEVDQGFVLLPTSVTGPQGLFCLLLFPHFVYNNLSLKAGGVLEDGCFELF
ncbi:hypothetical protein J1N35_011850 [Gossypium stocksii]|uniref:Ubiquitin-like domain-containing protein n=1 Tax=Gossypium stocksii TaxID=47602 RepID=A0A9D3W3H7_9ROSI|nr:hypothetical protein J1N35_011850 [Gossypium stocksii]